MILGPLEFQSPWWLLLAPALWLLAWWLARRSLSGLGPITRRAALIVRFVVIALLVAALAEPAWRSVADDVAVNVVLDVSRSVPTDRRERARAAIERAVENAPPDGRLGLVTVAQEAFFQALPDERTRSLRLGHTGERDASDIASGVRLAMADAPEDAALRLLLVSDGNETAGSLLSAAQAADAANVPIDVLPVDYEIEREVILESLITPPTARKDETINARFVLRATAPTTGRLTLRLNGQPVDLDPGAEGLSAVVQLEEGTNVETIPVRLTTSGPQRFEAHFEPLAEADDAIAQNNWQSGVTFVSGEGRVLVYADDRRAAGPLLDALREQGFDLDVRPTSAGHESLVELSAYDAAVLIDTPAYAFSQKQQEELRAYVHDLGGGLVMVGGPDSFGAGGWIGSPVADALPVKLDPPQKRVMPRGALALIMHSTEMPRGNHWGARTAKAAANSLSRLDLVGVLEYNWQAGGAAWAYPLSEVGDGRGVNQAIDNLTFGDMPSFNSSMRMALNALSDASAGQKHCIIISDGDPQGPGQQLVNQFAAAKISISTVSVFPHRGVGSRDVQKMRAIAQTTGGQFYSITSQNQLGQLPKIFIKEAQTIKRSLIWEGDPFQPRVVNMTAEPMRGISQAPALTGYVVTAPREGLSQITIESDRGDPIMAQWQHGLGRAVAFTSDAAPRWSAPWIEWGQYGAFWAQHLRWAMRPSGSANINIYTERRGEKTRVTVEAFDSGGERLNFARFQGRAVGPEGEAQNVPLRQTGPGRYEGEFATPESGSYVVNLNYQAPTPGGEGVDRGSARAAVTRSFAEEHRALEDNEPLLRRVAETTGGRMLGPALTAPQLFSRDGLTMPVARRPIWLPTALAALALLLLDVGVRRVRVDVRAAAGAVRRALSRSRSAGGEQVGALRTARRRAAEMFQQRGEGEAAGEQTSSPTQTAGVKFEAGEQEGGEIPLAEAGRPEPTDEKQKPQPREEPRKAEDQQQEDEEQGMSRLLRAKRRARGSMSDEDRDNG